MVGRAVELRLLRLDRRREFRHVLLEHVRAADEELALVEVQDAEDERGDTEEEDEDGENLEKLAHGGSPGLTGDAAWDAVGGKNTPNGAEKQPEKAGSKIRYAQIQTPRPNP